MVDSMLESAEPSEADIAGIRRTLAEGAAGLVLAAETALGAYPAESVALLRRLANEFEGAVPLSSSLGTFRFSF